jgi:hypothetical protein
MAEKLLWTLKEVAEMTGFPIGPLREDARTGRIEHVHRSRERFMTRAQIDKLIDRCTVRVSNTAMPRTAAEAEQIAMERFRARVARRLARRAGAAKKGRPRRLRSEEEIRAAGRAAVEGWPPLSEQQITTLAALFAPVQDIACGPLDRPGL